MVSALMNQAATVAQWIRHRPPMSIRCNPVSSDRVSRGLRVRVPPVVQVVFPGQAWENAITLAQPPPAARQPRTMTKALRRLFRCRMLLPIAMIGADIPYT